MQLATFALEGAAKLVDLVDMVGGGTIREPAALGDRGAELVELERHVSRGAGDARLMQVTLPVHLVAERHDRGLQLCDLARCGGTGMRGRIVGLRASLLERRSQRAQLNPQLFSLEISRNHLVPPRLSDTPLPIEGICANVVDRAGPVCQHGNGGPGAAIRALEPEVARDCGMVDLTELLVDAARRSGAYLAANVAGQAAPTREAVAALSGFDPALPPGPSDPASVLAQLDELGSPATMRSTGGRYFGFVNGGTEPAGRAAAILAGTWDQNAAMSVMSPVAARLDQIAAAWIIELLDLPASAVATFCGGASIANLTAVLAARDSLLERLGWSVDQRGVAGSPPLRVVTSAEIHVSALKALRAAGIGTDQIEYVATDDRGRLIADQLPPLDNRTLVVCQAGNVNTGHSDPFEPIVAAARDAGAWVHVDGAFGLWSAADPSRAQLVAGVDGADSWATDAHKWLNAPYDSGVCIVRDAADLRRAMATDAAYLITGDQRVPMHLGLQMSQRARGVESWAVIASLGRAGIADAINRTCLHCADLADRLAVAGVSILSPVVINQALAHFDDDETTDAVIEEVQADGTCWAGGTTWQGRKAMRLSVSSTTTTGDDIAVAAAAILDAWGRVRARV